MTIYDINKDLDSEPVRCVGTPSQGLGRVDRRLTAGLWVALVLLFWWTSAASAAPLPPQAQTSSINLEPYAALLLDPTGQMSFEEVSSPVHADRFVKLDGPLSLGFTRTVAWVKIELKANESKSWMLELGQPILEDVRLYERTTTGELQVRQGTLVDSTVPRELQYRRPVFRVDLRADETAVLYVRLASRTSMVTNLKLWSPTALLESSNLETFLWGLVFGSYFLVVFFYSAFWLWTREKVHLYYVLYVSTNLGAAFLTGRWNDMLGLPMHTNTHTMALGVFVCLSLWVAPVFTISYLGTHRIWPKSSRIYLRTCATLSVVCIGLVLLGYYSQGVMFIQLISMVVIFVTTGVSGHLAFKGDKKGQLMLLAFSLFYIGVMWRYMRNIGLIEPTPWNENVYQIGAFVHMMVMSTGIFSSYNTLRQRSEQEQARADAQERQRVRQYEFLGMVSHEVRTPLTVISASADNLLIDNSLTVDAKHRVSKIIRHSENLQKLFDTYLNNERLLNGDNAIRHSEVNLVALCEGLAQDMHDAHDVDIRLDTPSTLNLIADADLLRVAISNLLENARKHAPNPSEMALCLRRAGDRVQIAVTDEGPGVDERDMPFIFDAYFRGKGAYTSVGSGLGLHLVQFIAQQHQGRVFAKKREPCGMEFVIDIPLEQAP